MNKSLIALAVLAASGAAMAQVTVTGTLAMGYKATTLNTGAVANDSAGLGVDTSEIDFTATEDLGGGQKIEAKLAVGGADRSNESAVVNGAVNAVGGRDATLTYTNNSFGRVQLGTTRGDAVHSGIPSAGAPVIEMDGKLFEQRTSSDFISYAAPIGPVIFAVKLSEPSAGIGLGKGFSDMGAASKQRTIDWAAIYNSGPLTLVGAYRSYDNRNNDSIFNGLGLTKDNVVALQAGYDFGVAKVGLGVNSITATLGPKVLDTLVGVSVPMGAWTLGMTLASERVSGVADASATAFNVPAAGALSGTFGAALRPFLIKADGTANAMSFGAKYALSKRTSVTFKYATWTKSGYEQFESFGKTATADITTAGNAASVAGATAAVGAFAAVPAAQAAAGAAAAAPGATLTSIITAGVLAGGGAQAAGAQAAAGAAAATAATNSLNASPAAAEMGYKKNESEFGILLTYSF